MPKTQGSDSRKNLKDSLIPAKLSAGYEIHEWRNGIALLKHVYSQEWKDILAVLGGFKLCKSYIDVGGKNKSEVSRTFDNGFHTRGWEEKHFSTAVVVDNVSYNSPTHSIDCYRNKVALEVEWNNKDPFYDRDLNNFRLLFELRAISVGVIVTRCDALQDILKSLGRGASSGASTTYMRKLLPKIDGGGAGGCPLVVFGITPALYDENC